ncbi:nucleoside-diphosphate kinase [Tenacibaculum sp. 190524A02b]
MFTSLNLNGKLNKLPQSQKNTQTPHNKHITLAQQHDFNLNLFITLKNVFLRRLKNNRRFSKMATNRTFTMIKPDAVENGHTGAILEKINAAGFRIVAMKKTQMTKRDAETFYAIHSERPFFGELVEFMTRGPIVAAILEKDNAVEDFRTLIGATNPAEAAEGTIRKLYATSIGENAVHGSDSDENAAIEGTFHFSGREMF